MIDREEIKNLKVQGAYKLMALCGGTQQKMADMFGVTRQAVQGSWLKHGVPLRKIAEVMDAFEGRITKHELWPDVYREGEE